MSKESIRHTTATAQAWLTRNARRTTAQLDHALACTIDAARRGGHSLASIARAIRREAATDETKDLMTEAALLAALFYKPVRLPFCLFLLGRAYGRRLGLRQARRLA